MKEKEYVVIKDNDGVPISRLEVTSKELAQNVHGFIINGNIIKSIGEFIKEQELCKTLPDLSELEKENK